MANAKRSKKAPNRRSQCDAITRQKAKRQWWATFRRRTVITLAVAVGSYSVIGGWWMWQSGQISKAYEVASHSVHRITMDAGFVVQTIEVKGLNRLPQEAVLEAAHLTTGMPMLQVSLVRTSAQVSALPEVRHVQVRRLLPNRIVLEVDERRAVAIWQNEGHYALIDQDGIVLENRVLEEVENILLVVGPDAPNHTRDLRDWLASEPMLEGAVEAASRIGQRRWDVLLKNGVTVKLPEKKAGEAWRKLADMQRTEGVLDKAVKVVDMRVEGKLFLTLDEGAGPVEHPQLVNHEI